MNISGTWSDALAAGVALLLTACGGSTLPCTTCPSLAGTYSMTWNHTSACKLGAPSPATVSVSQMDSNLTLTLLGPVVLRGTLYDSNDFALAGSLGSTHYAMSGSAVPGAFLDAGTRNPVTMNGTITTSDSVSDAGCEGTDTFAGTRN
jgi:hypothetical protein